MLSPNLREKEQQKMPMEKPRTDQFKKTEGEKRGIILNNYKWI